MIYSNYEIAGNGLKLMFWGQILTLITVLVALINVFIGVLCLLAGGVMALVGLFKAGPAHPNYHNAVMMTVVSMVVGVLRNIFADNFLGGILTIAASVVSFLVTYYVCTASGELLEAKGDMEQANRAALIWKLFGGCTAVGVVCTLVVWIPVLNVLAVLASAVAGIVSLIAAILFLIFLYKAHQSLLA